MTDDQNPQNAQGGQQNPPQPPAGQQPPAQQGSGTPVPPPPPVQQPPAQQPPAQQTGGAPIPPPAQQPPAGQQTGGAPIPSPPAGQQPAGQQAGGAPIPPPPPKQEDTTPANFIIGQHLPAVINVKIPVHQLSFDEQHFLKLLAGSISLTKEEKKRIVNSIPKLKQEQVDELIRIFEEEKRKFAELSAKHTEQLKKLETQHWADWQDIELEQKAGEKQQEDTAAADEIRKNLGL